MKRCLGLLFLLPTAVSFTTKHRRRLPLVTRMSSTPPRPSWDDFAIEYEKRVEPFTSQFADEILRRFLVDDHNQQSEQQRGRRRKRRLLDVGCGTGGTSLLALSHGFDVTSTDSSEAMVGRTKERVLLHTETTKSSQHDNGIGIHNNDGSQTVADGQSLPPEWSDSFDVAIANFSVIFFPDPTAGLKEIIRCLVPSTGHVALSCWGDASETPAFRVFPDVAAEIAPELVSTGKPRRITGSVAKLTRLMEDAGFVDITVSGPVVKTLVVASPEEYYNRFALTSPPNVEMIRRMDDETRSKFRARVMEIAKYRGGMEDGSVVLNSAAYIACGRKP